MNSAKRVKRILAVTYLIVLHILVAYFLCDRFLAHYLATPLPQVSVVLNSNAGTEPTPRLALSITSAMTEANTHTDQTPTPRPGRLIIPVAGVKADQLVDSFMDARSDGRVHDAIDIPADFGTPVLAAADGEIIKFFDSRLGGITIYQFSADQKFVYYYAHLNARAEDVKPGDVVKQGKTIGFVGDTGNAGPGNYHLHFSVSIVTDPKRYWEGKNIDPYPYLKDGLAPETP